MIHALDLIAANWFDYSLAAINNFTKKKKLPANHTRNTCGLKQGCFRSAWERFFSN